MPKPKADAVFGRPEWLENFREWAARQSPATIAELIDVLSVELRGRNVAEHPAPGQVADLIRARQLVRVEQLVDDFLLAPARSARDRGAPGDIPGF